MLIEVDVNTKQANNFNDIHSTYTKWVLGCYIVVVQNVKLVTFIKPPTMVLYP